MIAPLPPKIDLVTAPHFFSPSRFSDLLKCRLMVIGEAAGAEVLPPSPAALFGTVLHHVRRELALGHWGGAADLDAAVAATLAAVADQVDAQLVVEPSASRLAPLRDAIGARTWAMRAYRLRSWVERVAPAFNDESAAPIGPVLARRTAGGSVEARLEFGDEAWLVAPALRLRGRADRVELSARERMIDIIDYKSGAVVDVDGERRPEASLQVRLYALVATELRPDLAVRLWLEGDGRHGVSWDPEVEALTRDQLGEVSKGLPADASLVADKLATPGQHCARCRLRPACRRYMLDAPSLWTDALIGPGAPFDTWGEVLTVTPGKYGHRVELRDANQQLVVVDGVAKERAVDQVDAGRRLYMFDLERSEDRRLNGRVSRPRNFHENPPDGGAKLRPARGAQVYLG